MYYYGYFRSTDTSQDPKGQLYKVCIFTNFNNRDNPYGNGIGTELTMAAQPFTTQMANDKNNLFKSYKCSSAVVRMELKRPIPDLNASPKNKVAVILFKERHDWRYENDYIIREDGQRVNPFYGLSDDYDYAYSSYSHFAPQDIDRVCYDIEWCGYATPNAFNQAFAKDKEIFELECQDALSMLQYYEFTEGGVYPLRHIFNTYLSKVGLYSNIYITNDISLANTPDDPGLLYTLAFDWSDCYGGTALEALSTALAFYSLTMVPIGNSIYITNYVQAASNWHKYSGPANPFGFAFYPIDSVGLFTDYKGLVSTPNRLILKAEDFIDSNTNFSYSDDISQLKVTTDFKTPPLIPEFDEEDMTVTKESVAVNGNYAWMTFKPYAEAAFTYKGTQRFSGRAQSHNFEDTYNDIHRPIVTPANMNTLNNYNVAMYVAHADVETKFHATQSIHQVKLQDTYLLYSKNRPESFRGAQALKWKSDWVTPRLTDYLHIEGLFTQYIKGVICPFDKIPEPVRPTVTLLQPDHAVVRVLVMIESETERWYLRKGRSATSPNVGDDSFPLYWFPTSNVDDPVLMLLPVYFPIDPEYINQPFLCKDLPLRNLNGTGVNIKLDGINPRSRVTITIAMPPFDFYGERHIPYAATIKNFKVELKREAERKPYYLTTSTERFEGPKTEETLGFSTNQSAFTVKDQTDYYSPFIGHFGEVGGLPEVVYSQRKVSQYSTPTRVIQVGIKNKVNPMTKVLWGQFPLQHLIVDKMDIDYELETAVVTLVERKKSVYNPIKSNKIINYTGGTTSVHFPPIISIRSEAPYHITYRSNPDDFRSLDSAQPHFTENEGIRALYSSPCDKTRAELDINGHLILRTIDN